MKRRAFGTIEAVTAERPGIQEVRVLPDADASGEEAPARPAMNLTDLTGPVTVGDRVLVNTVAVELGLGTGGFDYVLAVLERSPVEQPAPGHILKLRYTPLQTPVLAVEAPESPDHDALRLFATLDDLPVICAELHSQVPAICAAARWALRECGRTARIAYIMTDGAALPMAISRLVPEMRARGLIQATLTAGQAFGGDYEAVNLYSALAAAKQVVGANIAVVAQGPGNAGTGTPLGFSGVDQGLAVNAAASLGGVPILVPRISFAEERRRHLGLSHHTLTILTRITRAAALLPIPRLPKPELTRLYAKLEELGILDTHEAITIDAELGLQALEASGMQVTTMGRTLSEERAFFLAAAGAGLLAAQLVEAHE